MEIENKHPSTTSVSSKGWLLLLLFLLGSIWGLHFSIIKIAAESGLAFSGIAAITTFGVVIGLTGIAFARRKFPRWDRSTLIFYFVCGILGYVAPFILELTVASHLTAGLLTLIVATAPVWTILIAVLARVEKVSARRFIGIAIGLCSVALLLIPDTTVTKAAPWIWIFAASVIPLIYGCYHNYVAAKWPEGLDSWQVATGEGAAALCLLLPLFWFNGGELAAFVDLWSGSWTILVMVVFGIIEIYLYFELVRLGGPITVSQSNYVSVVMGVIWGMVILNEPLMTGLWVSVALLFISLFLTTRSRAG
jgi:drug/metabolite transporter (DMT)-like permease